MCECILKFPLVSRLPEVVFGIFLTICEDCMSMSEHDGVHSHTYLDPTELPSGKYVVNRCPKSSIHFGRN